MDPLGFAFENYDGVGAWRTREGRFLIDAAGQLPDGRKFNGSSQLRGILRSQSKQFVRCFSEKMLTYALGRGLTATDRCAVDAISQAVIKGNCRFSGLITEIVKSDPFRMQKGDGGNKA
jgi:hypothetical protein